MEIKFEYTSTVFSYTLGGRRVTMQSYRTLIASGLISENDLHDTKINTERLLNTEN